MLLFFISGLLSSFSAASYGIAYDKVLVLKSRSIYQSFAPAVILYGLVGIFFFVPILLDYFAGGSHIKAFNTDMIVLFIIMCFGYALHTITEAIGRKYTKPVLYNIAFQVQIGAMFVSNFFLQKTIVSWIGVMIVTAGIVYAIWADNKASKKESETSGFTKNDIAGIVLSILSAICRAVALTIDGYISFKVFGPSWYSWFLYEHLTFGVPACITLLIAFAFWLVLKMRKKDEVNPLRLIKAEMQSNKKGFVIASLWSYLEYVFAVVSMVNIPKVAPILQGLTPVTTALIEGFQKKEKVQGYIWKACFLILTGGLIICFG